MVRRVSVLGLAGALIAAAGCRHSCGDRGFLAGFGRGPAPCGLAGRTTEVCPDPAGPGVPVSGGGIGPGFGGTLVPGSGAAGPTEQLPPPTGYIPPAGVPYAPPTTAPPPDPTMGTLPAPKVGVPVKNGN
jgi:hypothetical protein